MENSMQTMNSLVPLKKVAFGTPEFMFLRRDIDILICQRNALKFCHENNEELYAYTAAMIRNMALLVYFLPTRKRYYAPVPAEPVARAPYQPKSKAKSKKNKITTKTLFE